MRSTLLYVLGFLPTLLLAKSSGSDLLADNFHWRNPFGRRMKKFDKECSITKRFGAEEYYLHDLHEPPPFGLLLYHDAAKDIFFERHYPGTWAGDDPHLYNRHLLMMDYHTLPVLVRRWVEEEERTRGSGRDMFYVFKKAVSEDERIKDRAPVPKTEEEAEKSRDEKKIVIFAPGAIYHILPLWVAEDSECKDVFSNLELYQDKADDGKVVAWVTSHSAARRGHDERSMHFVIQAHYLKAKEMDSREVKDEL